jgi:hypothetical protein
MSLELSPYLYFLIYYYSAFTDKPERSYHFLAPGRKCTTHHQALEDFPDTSQVSLYTKSKISSPEIRGAGNDAPVTVAFRFISERTV